MLQIAQAATGREIEIETGVEANAGEDEDEGLYPLLIFRLFSLYMCTCLGVPLCRAVQLTEFRSASHRTVNRTALPLCPISPTPVLVNGDVHFFAQSQRCSMV